MEGGGKGSGEDGGVSKGLGDGVQGGCPGSAPIWEENMGGHGHDDDGPGGFSPYDCQKNCVDEDVVGQCRRMVAILGVSGAGVERYMADDGVRAEAK